jgi:hypothetical protein
VEQVCAAVNLEVKDLMSASTGSSGKPRIVKVYEYTDEAGNVLYQNCRFEPKDFRQRKPDGKGGFAYKLNGVRRVPYNLVGLLQSELEAVFLTEGEKDADNLSALALLATSLKNWRPEFNQYLLRFSSVVILQDHDRAGVKQAADAARVISGSVRVLKVVDLFAGEPLPDKGGKDVSDWLEAGGTAERLLELVAAAPLWSEGAAKADDAPLSVVRMADVQAEEVRWLWPPYVPLGKLTILEGDPGLGKSWVTCALAAAVSRGKGLPGAEPFEPGNVLMLSAEDGLADTLRPRLDAVGADVSRVFALSEPLTFDAAGLLRLEAAIIEYSPLVVVIDPLFAYTGGKVDIHRANECRAVSAPLAAIAERQGCALLAVRHLGKSRGGGHALNAGIGSIDFVAAARSVLLVGQDPDEPSKRAIVHTKHNLTPPGDAVGYMLDCGQFFWTGASDLTAGRILAAAQDDEERGSISEAVDFLKVALCDGGRDAKAIETEARQAGINHATLRRAKTRLGIKSHKVGMPGAHFQKWVWELPEGAQPVSEDAQASEVEHLRASGADKGTYGNDLAEGAQLFEFEHLRGEVEHLRAEDVPDERAVHLRVAELIRAGAIDTEQGFDAKARAHDPAFRREFFTLHRGVAV